MSVELIYDTAPLGVLISWSNGQPRPPERFAAKLRIWERANTSGRLVRRQPAQHEKGFVAPASIVIVLSSGRPSSPLLSGQHVTFGLTSQLRFEMISPPPLGWFRLLSGEGDDAELLHLVPPDRATAEAWRQASVRPDAVLQEITADEIAAAIVEGRAAA